MKMLQFNKFGICISFGIDNDGRLLILGMGIDEVKNPLSEHKFYNALEIHTTGSNPDDHHGAKHTGSDDLYYKKHMETHDEICFVLENKKLSAKLIYKFYDNTKTFCAYSEIDNISDENIGLEYISSFCLYGIEPEKIYIPHNGWCRELDWKEYTPSELGYSKINKFSTKRITVSNTGTWSCKEYLPIGIISDKDRTVMWQIEHNGSWSWEISDIADVMYLKLSGPSEQENSWWKNLKPNEKFTTARAAVSISNSFDKAIAEMTKYRRNIAYKSTADVNLPVIFNDYMGCLGADPTTEKELPVIDAAAKYGAEIYCMDAGWYADGTWWETVGEWQVCEKRFKNGMKEVFDYIKSKGMIPGIWLEPESVGIKCPILDEFDDNCFFMRHGKRVIDHGRYHLDFRSKKVTDFLDSVVDRLVNEYNIGYFKFDYNIDGGVGTEICADSFGDGLMKHNEAFLRWVDGIYKRYPDLIIESCSSGGMRMDYKTLSHFSVQSLTDAEDYKSTVPISAMSQTAVIPEQASVWCIPKKEDFLGEVAVNVINTMFKRVCLSGESPWLDDKQKSIICEGIDFYKSIRSKIPNMTAFYPIGVCDFNSNYSAVGYTDGECTYICVVNLSEDREIFIPVDNRFKEAEVVYPKGLSADIQMVENCIKIALPKKSGVIIKLD